MRLRSLTFLVAFVATFIVQAAFAETVVFQEGANDPFTDSPYEGAEDNLLISIEPGYPQYADGNFGGYYCIGVGVSASATDVFRRKELIRFDLTSLAGKYTSINSVTLRLYTNEGESIVDFANNLQLFRLTAANGDWVEGTGYNVSQAGTSCWNYRAYGEENPISWDSGMAGTDAADYDGAAIAAIAFDSVPTGWVDLAFNDLSFIDAWVAGDNSGMILRVEDESPTSCLAFHSSEASGDNVQYRPQLVIDYATVPEPGALVLLLGLGTIFLCRRARRG